LLQSDKEKFRIRNTSATKKSINYLLDSTNKKLSRCSSKEYSDEQILEENNKLKHIAGYTNQSLESRRSELN
jgi:hypothetical protein